MKGIGDKMKNKESISAEEVDNESLDRVFGTPMAADTKPYARLCHACREAFIVPRHSAEIKCPFCGARHTVEWLPKLHLSDKGGQDD